MCPNPRAGQNLPLSNCSINSAIQLTVISLVGRSISVHTWASGTSRCVQPPYTGVGSDPKNLPEEPAVHSGKAEALRCEVEVGYGVRFFPQYRETCLDPTDAPFSFISNRVLPNIRLKRGLMT
jgi:hypothetical protein